MFNDRSAVFNSVAQSVADGTRPSNTTGAGVGVTAGNNTYGAPVSMIAGSSIDFDVMAVLINFSNTFVSGEAHDTLAQLLIDPAGGSSFSTVWINHLLCSNAAGYLGTSGGGFWYWFPLWLRAGTSIGCAMSANNASSSGRAQIWVYGSPNVPERELRVGTYVDSYGEDAANSRGTIITPGTTSEGAWTQLGSSIARPAWFWEYGVGINDPNQSTQGMHTDIGIGDASNKKMAIVNGYSNASNSEAMNKAQAGRYFKGSIGDNVYARQQISGALLTDHSVIAYAVGG